LRKPGAKILRVSCLRLILTLVLTSAAFAGETSNTSLEGEVERYADQTSIETWDRPDTMRAFFDTGLRFESLDGRFKIRIGGRLMFDNIWRSSDEFGPNVTTDSSFFRRVRLYMAGTIYSDIGFKVEVDFSRSNLGLQDVWGSIKVKWLGGATIKVGHHNEPFSLQELTSSKYIQLIERSVITMFAPGRNSGISIAHAFWEKRITATLGWFRTTNDQGMAMVDDDSGISFRVTGLVISRPEEKILLHVGFSFSYRSVMSVQYRARPGVGDKDRTVDTGSIMAEHTTALGFEIALRWRSVTVQGEYIMADVDAVASGDPGFGGFYIEIGWFVTGEVRQYSVDEGVWGRTRPKQDSDDGFGALQIVIRFETVDLNDASITGGEEDVVTLGANWHLNPNMRIMLNVVFADVTGGPEGTGDLVAFVIRFQIDF